MKTSHFRGPIFVVGMPRSGTKLLREILNNHSLIAAPPNESRFIPYYYKIIEKFGNLKDLKNFEKFFNEFSKTIFFKRLTQKEKFIDKTSWYEAVQNWTYAGIIEAFYKTYAKSNGKIIWADKTPLYLLHLPLLKSLFPETKFIHIIRDVRDYCVSINKAWNKNIYRAAQRWNDSIRKCRRDGKNLQEASYLEVQYEQLLDSPEYTAKLICKFLDIRFENRMLLFDQSFENLGDAKNHMGILKGNYGKWKTYFKENQIFKIERICGPLLSELGYTLSNHVDSKSVTQTGMLFYQFIDGFNLLRDNLRKNGLYKTIIRIPKRI